MKYTGYKGVIKGPTIQYIIDKYDAAGREIKDPVQRPVTCKDCRKIFTQDCPIRVWYREARHFESAKDVDPESDYCSKFEHNSKKGETR